MSDFSTPIRIGQANATGSTTALFLKLFSGEVLATFNLESKFQDLVTTRRINGGISATFPNFGRVVASYHVPGTEIQGGNVRGNERVISLDGKLIAPVFFPDIDQATNHWDYRAPISAECGRELARINDYNTASMFILAARATGNITARSGNQAYSNDPSGLYDGLSSATANTSTYSTTDTNLNTDSDKLIKACFGAKQALDEKNIPDDGQAFAAFRPAQYYLLTQNTKVLNRDWSGAGSFSQATVPTIAGLRIVKSNNIPNTNVTTPSNGPTTYNGDFTKTVGFAAHPQAVGRCLWMELSTEAERSVRHQGTLVVASQAIGMGVLRAEAAVEFRIP